MSTVDGTTVTGRATRRREGRILRGEEAKRPRDKEKDVRRGMVDLVLHV